MALGAVPLRPERIPPVTAVADPQDSLVPRPNASRNILSGSVDRQ